METTTMNWEQVPCNYEELCDRAAILREEVVGTEKLRWCWIAYFISDLGECRLGILFEGQHSWTNCCLLQKGYGKQANEWVKRLNEAEGISDKTTQEIVRSVKLGARACLTDDEQNVSIQVEGTPWGFDVAPSTPDTAADYPRPIQMRCIFTLEWALANDLANCLFRLMHDRRLPQPRRLIVDVEVIHDEDTAETTFCVPGDTYGDPHDPFVFTLTVDLQTAADLYDRMRIPEWFS